MDITSVAPFFLKGNDGGASIDRAGEQGEERKPKVLFFNAQQKAGQLPAAVPDAL